MTPPFPKIGMMPSSGSIAGCCWLRCGRLPDAVASYDRAIAIAPDYGEAMLARAAALGEMGEMEAALAACDRAIAVRPDLAEAFNLRGSLLWRLGRHDAALDAFNIALSHGAGQCGVSQQSRPGVGGAGA